MATGAADGLSSAASNSRPAAALRPIVRKKSPETSWPLITVAGPFPVMVNLPELANAAVPEKRSACAISRNIGSEKEQPDGFAAPGRRSAIGQSPEDIYPWMFGALRASHLSKTNFEGFSTGHERSSTASIKLKIALFAPIPRAKGRIAT